MRIGLSKKISRWYPWPRSESGVLLFPEIIELASSCLRTIVFGRNRRLNLVPPIAATKPGSIVGDALIPSPCVGMANHLTDFASPTLSQR